MTFVAPNDPLFAAQWHLYNTGQTGGTPGMDLNVLPVWEDYTGQGVRVGVMDSGMEYLHPDLVNNYNADADIDTSEYDDDAAPTYDDEAHGTSVAGLIAAEANNGIGGTGVAPGATVSGLRLDFYDPNGEIGTAFGLAQMANFDVVNNSWGYTFPFADNFASGGVYAEYQAGLEYAVEYGRNGLGTAIVFAGGNAREWGENSNYHNLENSRFTIAVAALTHNGTHTYYSTPGANLLVSAFGGDTEADSIVTTDRLGGLGYDAGDYTSAFGGTSSAAPMVSGVVALMLEANPNLGYRDIQEILAYSARQVDTDNPSWFTNGATNWNGGGLHTNTDYGFGLVDARAAVRLAETWTLQSTIFNEESASASAAPSLLIPDVGEASTQIALTEDINIDHVEVLVDIDHSWVGDLEMILTSPSGTQSVLMVRPGVSAFDPYGLATDIEPFTFSSTQFWGESSEGTWTLTLRDREFLFDGVLNSWTLRAYGDDNANDNTYVYTDAYATVVDDPARTVLSDTSGVDVLNAAAVTTDMVLYLSPGLASEIAGRSLTIANGTLIERAIGGDGRDAIHGNRLGNLLRGGRGNDYVAGNNGNDTLHGDRGNDGLDGGLGNDTLIGGQGADLLSGGGRSDRLEGGAGSDIFAFSSNSEFDITELGTDLITDFVSGVDQILLGKTTFSALLSTAGRGFSVASEFAQVANNTLVGTSSARIVYSQASNGLFYNPNGSQIGLGGGGQFAILQGATSLSADDFVLQG